MFTNNDPPAEMPPECEGPEAHMLGPLTDEEPPLMGLVGDITEEAAQQMAMSLLGFNGGKILAVKEDLEDDEDIEFFISSGGGSVNDMFSVYDLMQVVKANRDIATFGYGRVYSAAVLLLAAGTPGKRYMAKNARMMIHHCSSNAGGTHPDIRANFDELKKVEDMMVEALAEHSALSVGEIYNIMSRNTDEFFSAADALEMGIVDKII
jgi:ATP-dependent Clp endopeptidase proteolytic subunit ClpP